MVAGGCRAAAALRVSALGCHGWLSRRCCAAFLARRRVDPTCSASWQSRRCACRGHWRFRPHGAGRTCGRCALVLAATAVSEAVSPPCMTGCFLPAGGGVLSGQSAAPPCGRCPAAVGHPVAGGGRAGCLPARCTPPRICWCPPALRCIWGLPRGRTAALEQYGSLKGHGPAAAHFPPLGCWGVLAVC